jgi:thiamine-phosphate diphosphorylase
LQIIIENAGIPVIVDAGVGTASTPPSRWNWSRRRVDANRYLRRARTARSWRAAMRHAIEAGTLGFQSRTNAAQVIRNCQQPNRGRCRQLKMLPRLMLVTDSQAMQPDCLSAIHSALEGGARLIQLREKHLSSGELKSLAVQASDLCRGYGGTLVINSAEHLARVAKAGVHWPERHLNNLAEYSKDLFSGASVHSVESARRAQNAGADYLVFGSVFPTSSHPGAPAAGLAALRQVAHSVSVPVYAIGGISNEYSIDACLAAGAHGVAIRSAVWNTADVRAQTACFVTLVEAATQRILAAKPGNEL